MSYAHSFSPDFYGDPDQPRKQGRPICVVDALASMPEEQWREMIADMFPGRDSHAVSLSEVLDAVMETDSVSNLDAPVEVWIDRDGFHRVFVYDTTPGGPHEAP